ncbi:glycosyltransferase [Collinsella tanakaei]|nr:glycosyltransferase [Collinsella tanakaei]
MSSRPKVSVIVPMYNVETYLKQCVESIRNQTISDIEIILVDDGSPDRCGFMAEEYARLDERVKVVHRSNGGLGPARNSGLEIATGEYVGFVDSDDWIEPAMYERLVRAADSNAADIAFGGMKTVSFGKVKSTHQHPFSGCILQGPREIFNLRKSFYGAAPERIKDDPVPISVWLALYKRTFLLQNRIYFINVRSEDKFFNTHACRCASTVVCVEGVDYCYRKDDQPSITKTFERGTVDSFFRLFRLLEQMADEEPEEFWEESHVRTSRCIIDYSRVLIGMIEGSSSSEAEKRRYVHEVCRHPALARACKGYPFWKLPAKQAVFCICARFGMRGAVRLLAKLRKRIS